MPASIRGFCRGFKKNLRIAGRHYTPMPLICNGLFDLQDRLNGLARAVELAASLLKIGLVGSTNHEVLCRRYFKHAGHLSDFLMGPPVDAFIL
jgi:hypothetical protein